MKKVSFILVLAMLINMLTLAAPSFAAGEDATADSVLIYSSAFSDYKADGRPSGWVAPKYVGSNPETAPTGSKVTYVKVSDNNNAIKLSGCNDTAYDIIPFNKIAKSGKLHISFNIKRTADVDNVNGDSPVRVVLFNDYNPGKYLNNNAINDYSGTDKTDFRGYAYGDHTTHILYIPQNTTTTVRMSEYSRWNQHDIESEKTTEINKWYHFDMVVNLDAKTYNTYMDGEKLTTTDGKYDTGEQAKVNGFKGFTILSGMDVLVDDIAITQYAAGEEIQMMLDSGNTIIGPDVTDGKCLKVSFNEYLVSDLRNTDFEVKDASGNEVTGFTILSTDKTNNSCTLDFTSAEGLKANTDYTVTVKTDIKGKATDASAQGASAVFRTAAKVVDTSASDYRFYYADEDFDSFTDNKHLPLGFYKNNGLQTSNYSEQYSKYLSTEDAGTLEQLVIDNNDGKAMKLKNNSPSVYYFFPRGIVTGDFTVEFDMSQKGGAWSMGLKPARNWTEFTVVDKAVSEANGKSSMLDNYRQINSLIGMSGRSGAADNIKTPNLAVVTAEAATVDIPTDSTDTGLDIAEDVWTHIKLDFDMADGKLDITLTDADGNETSKTDVSYGDWNKFGAGVEGLILRKNNTGNGGEDEGNLCIDNLQVYTESAKLLDQDFNGYTSATQTRFPYFWTSELQFNAFYQRLGNCQNKNAVKPRADQMNAYTVSGKSGESGDNAVKLTRNAGSGMAWYTTQFARRVPAGESYAVEFDLKSEGDSTVWNIAPVDATRTTNLSGYNDNSGKATQFLNDEALLAGYNGNLYKYIFNQNATTFFAAKFFDGTNTTYFEKIATLGETEKSGWNHYKLVAVPQESNTKYILKVNDGEAIEFTDKLKNNKKDICGISIALQNANRTTETSWGVSVDNVQAYLCDASGTEINTARENSITDIKAEKADGTSVSIKNAASIPYSTKKITIEFSEDLNEVKKADLTAINLTKTVTNSTTSKSATATGTTTAIYDCIEDVIQLRSERTAYPMSYSSEISGNKYIITLNDMVETGKTYSLHIAKNVNFKSSPFSSLDSAYSMTFTGTTETDGYLMSDFQLVKKSGTTYEAVADLSDIQTNEESLAVKLSGINTTGEAKKMKAIVAFYNDAASTELVNVALVDFDFAAIGKLTDEVKDLTVSSMADGKTYSSVKLFVWDADTLKPMTESPICFK